MDEFLPLNKLEATLLDAQHNIKPVSDFVQQLWASELAIPTAGEVRSDGSGFLPVVFEKLGTNMLAAFTSKERMGHLQDLASYCMVIKGEEVLRRLPKGYGLVVNPGLEVGLEISPLGIADIITRFG